MKYQVRQQETRYSIDIDGKYDFTQNAPIQVDKKTYQVKIIETDANGAMKTVMINNRMYRMSVTRRGDGFPDEVILKGIPYKVEIEKIESTRYRPPSLPKHIPGDVTANMPGQVISLMVQEGEQVEDGQVVLILEAMKMENEIVAPKSGVLKKMNVKEGTQVMKGDKLFEVS